MMTHDSLPHVLFYKTIYTHRFIYSCLSHIFFLIATLDCHLSKDQFSEAGEDWAAFQWEMLQLYKFWFFFFLFV